MPSCISATSTGPSSTGWSSCRRSRSTSGGSGGLEPRQASAVLDLFGRSYVVPECPLAFLGDAEGTCSFHDFRSCDTIHHNTGCDVGSQPFHRFAALLWRLADYPQNATPGASPSPIRRARELPLLCRLKAGAIQRFQTPVEPGDRK